MVLVSECFDGLSFWSRFEEKTLVGNVDGFYLVIARQVYIYIEKIPLRFASEN